MSPLDQKWQLCFESSNIDPLRLKGIMSQGLLWLLFLHGVRARKDVS